MINLTEDKIDQLIEAGPVSTGGKDCMWLLAESNICPVVMRSSPKIFGEFTPDPEVIAKDGDTFEAWGYYTWQVEDKLFVNFVSRVLTEDNKPSGAFDRSVTFSNYSYRLMALIKMFGEGAIWETGKIQALIPQTEDL